MQARVETAIQNPHTTILGHPTARLLLAGGASAKPGVYRRGPAPRSAPSCPALLNDALDHERFSAIMFLNPGENIHYLFLRHGSRRRDYTGVEPTTKGE